MDRVVDFQFLQSLDRNVFNLMTEFLDLKSYVRLGQCCKEMKQNLLHNEFYEKLLRENLIDKPFLSYYSANEKVSKLWSCLHRLARKKELGCKNQIELEPGYDRVCQLSGELALVFQSGWGWWFDRKNRQSCSNEIFLLRFSDQKLVPVKLKTGNMYIYGIDVSRDGKSLFVGGKKETLPFDIILNKNVVEFVPRDKISHLREFKEFYEVLHHVSSLDVSPDPESCLKLTSNDDVRREAILTTTKGEMKLKIHENHVQIYASDSRYALVAGDDSGEDATYSLSLVDHQALEVVATKMRIPGSNYIECEWRVQQRFGHIIYVATGGDCVSKTDRRPPCTLWVIGSAKKNQKHDKTRRSKK